MSATQLYLIFHIYKVGRKKDDSLLKKYDEVYTDKFCEALIIRKDVLREDAISPRNGTVN